MPYEIQYNKEDDYIEATFTGVINMRLVRDYIAALLPILEETGCKRLLSDSMGAQLQLTSMDILKFPKMAEESPLTAGLKRAVLAAEGSSGYEMYATFSKMQGQNLRVFTDRDEAVEWLFSDGD
jgi:hypothetical protein